jgi:hypothetical protein
MRWRVLVGGVLTVLGAARLLLEVIHFQATAYAVGGLTAGVLFLLLGVWLIRSGRQEIRG